MADWIDLYFPRLLGDKRELLEVETHDSLNAGDPVYIVGVNCVGQADAASRRKSDVIGIVESAYWAGDTFVEVLMAGMCRNVLSGAVAGARYYLQPGGGIGASLPPHGNNYRCIRIGIALNASDLLIQIMDYGVLV